MVGSPGVGISVPVDMSDENTTPADVPVPKPDEPNTPETATAEADHAPAAAGHAADQVHDAHHASQENVSAGNETPASGEPPHGVSDAGAEEGAPAEAAEAAGADAAEAHPPAETGSGEPESASESPAAPAEPPVESKKKWYVVKVQSGREESIRSAIERKMKIEGLEEFFGQIAIPTEDVVEKKKVKARVKDKKTGEVETVYQEKNVTKKRKKFPGYLFAEVEFNDQILYLFRETSGVGDFVGATHHRAPNPMSDRDVKAMLTGIVEKGPSGTKVKVKLDFEKGDKVRIREGAFSGMEGDVKAITEAKDATESPKVTVVVSIFGRPVDVDLDYWQVDKA